MKESAAIAVSYVRSIAQVLGIDPGFYKEKDIHIHFPEGALPKDGPSAGVAMTCALISALTERTAKRDVAMTGEITLHGKILPIGGLREKTLAAYRSGIHTVIIPKKNIDDLEEVDPTVREKITFVPCETVMEAVSIALNPAPLDSVSHFVTKASDTKKPVSTAITELIPSAGRERRTDPQL
jgi:ATP-dependent Lon protease